MDVLATVLAAWSVGGSAILGLGLLLTRAARWQAANTPGYYLDSFWLGLAATIATAQIWHLWFPMNAAFVLLVAFLGAAGLFRTSVGADLAATVRCRPALFAAFAVGAVWLALMELRPLELYDAGLYHLQAILWNNSYPTVPGLGNLHGRLAFYTSYFLLHSAFNLGPLTDESYRAVAGLLALVFLTQVGLCVGRAVRALRGRHTSQSVAAADWLLALMALPSLIAIGNEGVSTTSSDLPVFLLEVLVVYYALRSLERNVAVIRATHLGLTVVLATLAVTTKLNALPFALASVVLVLVLGEGSERQRAPFLLASAISSLLLVGMLVNSIILSGYPLYPSTLFAMPVDWRIPEVHALFDSRGIGFTARQPHELSAQTFEGLGWVLPWLDDNAGTLAAPVIGAVIGVLALLVARIEALASPRRALLLVLPAYIGIAFWFVTAPSYRFAGALIWLAGAIPLALLCASDGSRLVRALTGAFVLAAFLPTQAVELSLVARQPVAAIRQGLSPVPEIPMDAFVTHSGLTIFVPRAAEVAWNGPLPSTPYPDPDLRARCPDSLACGFATDLGWWSDRARQP